MERWILLSLFWALDPLTASDAPVFDVPRVEGIHLNAEQSSWRDQGLRISVLAGDDPFPAQARAGWDDRGLVILVTVQDETWQIAENPGALYEADSVEIFVSPVHHTSGLKVEYENRDVYQVLCAPEGNGFYVYDSRVGAKKAVTPAPEVRSRKIPGGYQIAVRIPWAELGGEPETEFGLQIHVNDKHARGLRQIRWNSTAGKGQTVRLSESSGKHAKLAASGRYEGLDTLVVSVLADSDSVGQPIAIRAGDQVLASGKLEVAEHGSALTLHWSTGPNPPTSVTVFLGDEAQALIELPSLDQVRANALRSLRWVPTPGAVFTGSDLPAGQWSDVRVAEELLDPESLKVTFYDSDLQPVTRAEKIGRYTAFIEARTKGGEALRRTLTLFRAADGFGGSVSDNPAMTALAAGVPAGVVSAHADWVRAMSDSDPAESRRLRSTFAAQLAALFESSASGPAPCSRAMEENEVYRIQKLRGEAVSLPYVLTPSKGLDPATSKALTLLVFLHGTGNGNEKTALNAPIRRYALEHSDPPFLLVQPLCPPGTAWVPAQLDDLLNDLVSQYDIDPDQIIVTGFSMGGFGTWNLGIFYPGRFAALAPLAAYGEVSAVPAIGKTPVFAWHGDRDAIPWQRHRLTVEALNAAGGQGTFTLLPGINHTNTEEAVYLDPEFYRALWKAKRAEP